MKSPQLHLLLVEDDPADAKLEKRALLKSNTFDYRIETATRLSEARQALSDNPYDIVLSDLGLPDSQGLETFRQLNELVPETPIIVLSGLNDESTALEAVQMGAQDYLLKQYDLDKILSRSIGYAIERKRLSLESKKARQLTETSREQFRSLVETISNQVLILQNGCVQYANPAFKRTFYRVSSDIENGKLSCENFIHPDSVEICRTNINRVQETGANALVEIIVTPEEDLEIEMLAEFRPVRYNGEGAVQLVMTDISEYKKLARMKDQFLSMASHELKTPMNIISGFADLMSNGAFGEVNTDQKKHLQMIKNEAFRITRFVSGVLNYARYEGEWVIERFDYYPLKPLVNEVVESLEHLLIEKQIRIHITPDVKDQPTRINIDGMKQVFLNLISNAMKYTPPNGVITVRITDETKKVVIVEDTGQGIDPDILEEIFEPFVHSDDHTLDGTKGAGLGLAIAKKIIRFHNGDIWVESKQGEGTRFFFTLPLDERE